MGAAGFRAVEGGVDEEASVIEQEAELQRLREIVVEDVALVVDDDPLVALAE